MNKLVYVAVAAAVLAVGISSAVVAANKGKPYPEGHAPAGSWAAFSASPQTFPNSTTIYIVPSARDDGSAANTGTATVVGCTNVSGVTVTVRFLALNFFGTPVADRTTSIANGATVAASTHNTVSYNEAILLNSGPLSQGAIDVESTNAAVFCTAMTINAAASFPEGVDLHVVRVNGLAGTQE
jgi:hypothetical protein